MLIKIMNHESTLVSGLGISLAVQKSYHNRSLFYLLKVCKHTGKKKRRVNQNKIIIFKVTYSVFFFQQIGTYDHYVVYIVHTLYRTLHR